MTQAGTPVSAEAGDARAVPADGFDLVYVFDSLHHISDPQAVLASVRQSLVSGGVVLVAENDFTGDLDQARHVRWTGFGEFLGAAGEKDLEPRWRSVHQHP